ncbi:urea transporter [Bacteroides helcogenes]|uniref:Urea transporter n=1 Tax=Bacteroides helcogenes (strain ATCC 35417 / DSM 20613 / JCM 6297 / CCUG 15421 / P 36-108) TaxID=693979 RepID=E6SU73_BACT6|nr:urea transporter [Bacteroides helcogenes]ADV44346.1 Urea transporter [Bacteroides helcogenes P 36-108]MDY5238245.1 urea transporter [Bacteroides helcogenes]
MYKNILILGRGIGQVMFQNNAASGGLMLIGIACNSWQLAILSVIGTLFSTMAASLFGYDKEEISNGLYGFNGALVGIAIGVFWEINIISMLLLVSGSVLSVWIAGLFRHQSKLPGLTAPFVLVIWLLLIVFHYLLPALLLPPSANSSESAIKFIHSLGLSIGQVMFQGNVLSGLFFFLGILINSRLNAVYTILGAILPLFMVLHPHTDLEIWNSGLLGYNGVLCAIALGDKTLKGGIQAGFSVMLSVVLQIVGMQIGIVTLTAPFVISVWVTMLLSSHMKK